MKLVVMAMALCAALTGLVGSTEAVPPNPASIRAFEEPLVAIGTSSPQEDAQLAGALAKFQQRKSYEDVSAITDFIAAHPQSPWNFSLWANLGIIYRKAGYFSRAIDAWERAWALGKAETDTHVQALASRVAGELASLLASLGRMERLKPLLEEVKGRPVYGSTGVLLMSASESLFLMKNKPGTSFKCGPYALKSIRSLTDLKDGEDPIIKKAESSPRGFSLTQVCTLANQLHMDYQMAKRTPGATLIVPSVAHWKSGHYAAVLEKKGDLYLTQDPTFVERGLVTAAALEDECDGYFLVPKGHLPKGWQTVSSTEGDTVWGRGVPSTKQASATSLLDGRTCPAPPPAQSPSSGPKPRMAAYSVLLMLVSLSIWDNPVGYTPPIGPPMEFTIIYNELEATQPATFTFSNFGPSWNCSWFSYIDIPVYYPGTPTYGPATVHLQGGGSETYSVFTFTPGITGYVGHFEHALQSQTVLWITTSGTYERRFPDGSKEVFAQLDSPTSPVRAFLTTISDNQGKSCTLSYDSTYFSSTGNLRLSTVTDALGLVTTLAYGGTDPLRPTQITDPYGRSASFTYDTSTGQLIKITDVIGIQSQFTYASGSSSITQMTTPYGNTTFTGAFTNYLDGAPQVRTATVTEPDGGGIKVQSRLDVPDGTYPYSDSDPSGTIPAGMSVDNLELGYTNTYYWDKKAMHDAPNDYTKAHIYHWLANRLEQAAPVLQCEKPALENRIWYQYFGQTVYNRVGASANPIYVGRVVNGTSEIWAYQYSNSANPNVATAVIDPLGRQTNYTYDSTTGIDLQQVTQKKSAGGTETLLTITYDGTYPPHRPKSITDAAGQTTTFTYNSDGQVTSITPPTRSGHSAETTTYTYTGNYLTSITGPMTGATLSIVPDTLNGHTINRPQSLADAESYTRSYTYDNLDRVTHISYPDGTSESFSYTNPTSGSVDLDLHSATDRLGRTTTWAYDAVRHVTSTTDPLSRTTSYTWCSCGSMTSLTDAKGNVTTFNRDVEGRLTSKVYQGETAPGTDDYTYDGGGRLSTYRNKRLDVATFSYNADDTVSGISYSLGSGSTSAATSSLAYTYETDYLRLHSAAIGGATTTTFGYVGVGSLGAGSLSSLVQSLTGGTATVTYTYDEWGRKVGRDIDSANSQTVAFDALGRISSLTNLLGAFTYAYFDPSHPTNRLGSVTYPNGQSTVYDYFGNTSDERLKEIKNLTPASAVQSQHDYVYDAVGRITTWQQQIGSSTPLLWTNTYDAADQLTSAVQTNTSTHSVAASNVFLYNAAGNRTQETTAGLVSTGTFNGVNQLTDLNSTASATSFNGSLDKPGTLTINGSAVSVDGSNNFSTSQLLPSGTNTVTFVAQDTAGNKRTNKYQVVVPTGTTNSPTYDADGNELSNGAGQSYTWNARNQLVGISYSSGQNSGTHSEFTYDGTGHRNAIIEKSGTTYGSGTVSSTKQLVWDTDVTPAEERDASNTVTKRFYGLGQMNGSTKYFYNHDHLGSVREMTDNSGTLVSRLDYDPYGRATVASGSTLPDFQYAGYYQHVTSGLNLTLFRAYDSNLGRWLSRDPMGEGVDATLYSYGHNNPIRFTDLKGLGPLDEEFEELAAPLLEPLEAEIEPYVMPAENAILNEGEAIPEQVESIWEATVRSIAQNSKICPTSERSDLEKQNFLKQLMNLGRTPRWMNQWLNKGLVPPGYNVDHIRPLWQNGIDDASNMALRDEATHTIITSAQGTQMWQQVLMWQQQAASH